MANTEIIFTQNCELKCGTVMILLVKLLLKCTYIC